MIDRDIIVLRDGKIKTDAGMVSGSVICDRTYRPTLTDDEQWRKAWRAVTVNPAARGLKWCSHHAHSASGDGNMPLSEFTRDPKTSDGLDVYCNDCRAREAQRRREAQAEAAGRVLRQYVRWQEA